MKCPQCNAKGTLTLSYMFQISHDYKIKRDGTLPKKYMRSGEHSMEWSIITCSNCDFYSSDLDGNYDFDIIDNKVVFNLEDK